MFPAQAINQYLSTNPDISSKEYTTLCALSSYFGDKIECWPKQKTLSERTKLSIRTIKRAIQLLKEKGLILVKKVRYLNHYFLNTDFFKGLIPRVSVTSKVPLWPLRSKQRNKEEILNVCDNERRMYGDKNMNNTQDILLDKFEPNEYARQLAATKGIDLELETEKFKNYYKAKGKLFIHLHPLFTNWLLTIQPRIGNANHGTRKSGSDIIWDSYRRNCPEDFNAVQRREKDVATQVDGPALLPIECDIPF
jgi:hypothetical protein